MRDNSTTHTSYLSKLSNLTTNATTMIVLANNCKKTVNLQSTYYCASLQLHKHCSLISRTQGRSNNNWKVIDYSNKMKKTTPLPLCCTLPWTKAAASTIMYDETQRHSVMLNHGQVRSTTKYTTDCNYFSRPTGTWRFDYYKTHSIIINSGDTVVVIVTHLLVCGHRTDFRVLTKTTVLLLCNNNNYNAIITTTETTIFGGNNNNCRK